MDRPPHRSSPGRRIPANLKDAGPTRPSATPSEPPGIDLESTMAPGAIRPLYQPIFELSTGRVVGYEALARFDRQPERNPAEWFAFADPDQRHRLELSAIRAHIARFADIPAPMYLALNVSPATAVSEELGVILGDLPGDRIVLEITATRAVSDYGVLEGGLATLRSRGVRLAVDDAGEGLASLGKMLRLAPDIIKLDVGLTRGLDSDPGRRSLASAFVAFAGQMGIAVVAEGVETAAEFGALVDLGVGYGQGFFLARPAEPSSALAGAEIAIGGPSQDAQRPVRVAIVDDHAMVAQAVAAMIAAQIGLEVTGVASDVAEAVELLDRGTTDVAVCDIQLGNESGFVLLKRYETEERPHFVMYSSYDHPAYHRAAFEGGAAGFVLKMAEPAELIAAIRTAAAGRTSFSPATLQAVRSAGEMPTLRELAVLEGLADGQSTTDVAATLGIRPRTVESHLRALFDRTGVLSRTELVLYAIRQGWIRPRTTGSAGLGTAERSTGAWMVDAALLRAAPRDRGAAHRSPKR